MEMYSGNHGNLKKKNKDPRNLKIGLGHNYLLFSEFLISVIHA